jgi:hypothetical protein
VNVRTGYSGEYVGLPSYDARLWDEARDEKLETPLDEFGRVDLDKLIAQSKQTVEPGYSWQSEFDDVHHLQWPAVEYVGKGPISQDFRELVRRKTYIPRRLHNWIHLITEPPPVPDTEVMQYSIAAHRTVLKMASTAQLAARLSRMPGIPEDKLEIRLEEELENYMLYVEQAREVPTEFRILHLADVEARNAEELLRMNRRFGRKALLQIPVRTRDTIVRAA